MTKIVRSRSISQRRGSGSVPKCHGSATLLKCIFFLFQSLLFSGVSFFKCIFWLTFRPRYTVLHLYRFVFSLQGFSGDYNEYFGINTGTPLLVAFRYSFLKISLLKSSTLYLLDTEALTYLMLGNELVHRLLPGRIRNTDKLAPDIWPVGNCAR
jgi:hypothetical protein